MERLPIELLFDIFSYACTDGGFTGRSLSAVSTYVRDVSEHVRYQSITVYGEDHIATLASRLSSSHPNSGLRYVRHLLLSDRPLKASSVVARRRSDGGDNGAALVRDITIILNHVAAHLESLLLITTTLRKPTPLSLSVMSFLPDLPFLPLIPTKLPVLREITLVSPLIPLSFQHSHQAPCLERMHITTHHELPADFGPLLRTITPNLTHLRVSSLRGRTDGGGLLDMMRASVLAATVPCATRLASLMDLVPPRLRRIIVTPKPVTRARGALRVFGSLAQDLEQVCSDDAKRMVLVLHTDDCLKEDQEHEKELYNKRFQVLRDEWLERIEGRRGCWVKGSGYTTETICKAVRFEGAKES